VRATDPAGNVSPDATFTWTIGAQTYVAYMGPFEVTKGTSFKPVIAMYSDNRPCMVGQPISGSLDRNPVSGAPGAYPLVSGTSDADGRVTGPSTSTATWQEGVYTVTVTFAGTASCGPATATASLRVGRDTTLVADAIIAEVIPALKVTLGTFTGTLTQTVTGAPIANANLDFYVGTQYICSATTDANGQASCGGLIESVEAILNLEYTAKFNGDAHFLSSTANGPLLRLAGIPILPV
jgi:5-hydroxyisourate hydrolase-like protein (transthyretin family)